MKAFTRYALLAYFMVATALACHAQVSLFGTANNVSADTSVTDEAAANTTVAATENEQAAKEAKTTMQTTNKNPLVGSFLSELKKMADEIEKANSEDDVWYWSNSHNKNTFKQQKASDYKVTNNALFCSWALQGCGVFEKGDAFYFSNGEIINNGGNPESAIDEYFDIIDMDGKPKDLVKEGKIIAGDIVGYDYTHTNVYAGDNLWYDPSPKCCEVRSKDGNDYFVKLTSKKGAGNHNVTRVLRFKDGSKPKDAVASTTKKTKKENTEIAEDTSVDEDYTGPYKKDKKSFLAALKKMSEQCKKDYKAGKTWLYSNEQCHYTYKEAIKGNNRRTNCARYVNWGLSEIGVIGAEVFWTTDKGEIFWERSGTKQKVLKYAKIITVRKKMGTLIKEGTLQAGDICCYNFCHTNVYAGNKTWYDAGRRSDTTFIKNGNHYFKSFHTKAADLNWTVNYIIRLNE